MNDNDNIKELIGARLEEIHLSETMTDTMPSDEEILRWETLAQALRAQKQRNKRRLLSMAAVFLLAVVISVAVIVSPPDAEAGGDGRAVIVDMTGDKALEVNTYKEMAEIPRKIKEQYLFFDGTYNLELLGVTSTTLKDNTQIEIVYKSEAYGTITILESIVGEDFTIKSLIYNYDEKINYGGINIFIIYDENNNQNATYSFIYNNVYVSVFCERNFEKIIEDALS